MTGGKVQKRAPRNPLTVTRKDEHLYGRVIMQNKKISTIIRREE